MVTVYIASPYTVGDKDENVRQQIDAAEELMNAGLLPFWPLHSHYHHLVYEHSWDEWMELSLGWVDVCDCLLRLPGESRGADIEVEHAQKSGKMIFYSTNALINYYHGEKNNGTT